MRLGVFGGTFDPPHNGHLALCLEARARLGLDRLIISVSKNPLKAYAVASDADRKAMAELLAGEINVTGNFAEVIGWELDRPGPSYTVDLLHHLRELYPDAELILLIGEDSYHEMPRWRAIEEIASLCRIVVFMRSRESFESDSLVGLLPTARIVDFDMPVSATAIRRLVAEGGTVSQLLPASISRYMAEHALYR